MIASLAGATKTHNALRVPTRIGGFGGIEGLTRFLRAESIRAVIDATHPFAAQMSANAMRACAKTSIPLLRLERPNWEAQDGGDWHDVEDAKRAPELLPHGARVFLTVGARWEAPFAARHDLWCLRRRIEPPLSDPFESGAVTLGRPPFALGDEITLLRDHRITHLVTKNSGGPSRTKLDAAQQLAIPIIMIARPTPPATECVETPAQAVQWLERNGL